MNHTESQPARIELVVVRCQLGERPAFDELVDLWHRPLWRFVRRLVNTDHAAEEVVQETWVRVLRALPSLRDASRFPAWFYGIARRTLTDRLRVQYAQAARDESRLDEVPAPEPEALSDEDVAALHAALGGLPLLEREAITLFYLKELSLRAIAEVVGAPEGTVKSRLHRARRLLREALEKEERHEPAPPR